MDEIILQKAFAAIKKNNKFAFVTVVDSTLTGTPRKFGAKMIVYADGSIFGTIGGGRYEKQAICDALKSIKSNKPVFCEYECFGKKDQPICGGSFKVFIEPCIKAKKLIICGCGHIGLSLSIIAKMLQFEVTVIDNRKEFANKVRFPHVDKVFCGDYRKCLESLAYDKYSSVVILTHAHEFDFDCLNAVIRKELAFVGVISSKAKRLKFLKDLKANNVGNRDLKKLFMPVGLDIGSQTPEEIAISIISHLVYFFNNDGCKVSSKLNGNVSILGI